VISTRSGKTVADGVAGQGSPFACAFASILPTPRLRIALGGSRCRGQLSRSPIDEVSGLSTVG
jgi:hypothetical protein